VSRVRRNQQSLAPLRRATIRDLEQVNRSMIEAADPYEGIFYPLFVHALRGERDPLARQALVQLHAWHDSGFARTDRDGDGREDHPGLAVFELDPIDYAPPNDGFAVPLGEALIKRVLGPVSGGASLGGTYQSQLSAVYEALSGRAAHRFADDPDGVIRRAIAEVLPALAKKYKTTDVSRWHQQFPTESFTPIGVVGPAPVKGMDHGSYSQIVDLGAGRGENVEPPGNVAADSVTATVAIGAGRPPPHFEDQRKLYEDYRFKPMRLRPTQYRSHPEEVIRLDAGGDFGSSTSFRGPTSASSCGPSEGSRR
jgi:hypothetical protein